VKGRHIAFVALCAVLPAPAVTGSGEDAAIRANVAAYEAAWNSRDVAGVVATFAPDGDFVAFDGPRIAGHEALRKRVERDLATAAPGTRIRLTVTSVRLLDPQTAVAETEAHFSEGSVPDNRGTSVLVRHGQTWLVAALRVFPAERP
jgi:uncharacterized protein (TIGR02246 family)